MKYEAIPSTLLAALIGLSAVQDPGQPKEGPGPQQVANDWLADLDHLVDQVRFRHVDPFRYGASEDEYLAAADSFRERIPSMDGASVVVELLRLHAMLRDTHSEALWDSIPSEVMSTSIVPVGMESLRGGVFVTRTSEGYQALLGARVLSIGGHPIEDVVSAAMEVVSGDNDMHRRTVAVRHVIRTPAVLHALGLIEDPIHLMLETQLEERVRQDRLSTKGTDRLEWFDLEDVDTREKPGWSSAQDEAYSYRFSEAERVMYVQINQMEEDPRDPFSGFCERLFREAAEREAQKLVLDLRYNSGGDPGFGWPYLHRLALSERWNRRGASFVIFGRDSKSAAPTFVVKLLQLVPSVVTVGEPTGGRPNGYGNPSVIELPNSGIRFLCSQLFVQPSLEPDPRPWIAPEVTAELSPQDIVEGRDPAWDAIVHYEPGPNLRDFLGPVSEETRAEHVIEAFEDYKGIHRNKWRDVESDLNMIGYEFIRGGQLDDAIAVFEHMTRLYPERYNPLDSLAEAYARKGMNAKAIELYRRSFLMGRLNRNALRQLRALGWNPSNEVNQR